MEKMLIYELLPYMSIGTGDIIDDAMTTAKLSLDSVYIIW
jgi:hypothetical protein